MPWVIIILGYFLGAIPTAYLAGRVFRGVDIRQLGDRNMGAANAYRELGTGIGIAVGFLDADKGALAVLLAQAAHIPQAALLTTGIAAVIGHNWPVFIGFRGGRGVSTTIGVLLAGLTQPVLLAGAPAALVLLLKKNVTLACAVLFIPLPLVCWWLGISGLLIAYGMALPALVGVTHALRAVPRVARQA